jgi:gamma-glutamyltranspeptidase
MVLKKVNKKYRVNLVAEIMAKSRGYIYTSEQYLMRVLSVNMSPQSLIDEPQWHQCHHGFEYWKQAFNEHGHEQR